MKKILIINAHQKYEGVAEGKLNQTFTDVAKEIFESQGCEVKLTSVEKGYDIEEEISKHEWADLVFTQTPVYWFASPWIHKKYIDELFTTGMFQGRIFKNDGRTASGQAEKYGTGGLCQGKKYMLSASWNSPEEAFGNKNQKIFEGKTQDDVLISLWGNYKAAGFEILPGFHSHDVMKAPQVQNDVRKLKERLLTLF